MAGYDVTISARGAEEGARRANSAFDSMTRSAKKTTSAIDRSSGSFDKLKNQIIAAFSAYKAFDIIRDIALMNARFETLGVVMGVVGNNAGYSRAEMEAYAKILQKTGIAMTESHQVLIRMAQAQMDLTQASKLARLAQNAAVIGQMNSSQAFERMVYGIQSGQTEILRTIGLNVNFEQSYRKLAEQLDKSAKNLTETEKIQARTNAVMKVGANIAGTYEAAMNTAGKKVLSMKRYTDDLKVSVGEVFNPSLSLVVEQLSKALKETNKELDDNKTIAQEWGKIFRSAVIAIEAEVIRLAMLLDKVGGTMTTVGMFLTGPGSALGIESSEKRFEAFAQSNIDYEARYNENDRRLQQLANLSVALENEESSAAEAAKKQAELEKKRMAAAKATREATKTEEELATAFEKAKKDAKDYAKSQDELLDRLLPLRKEQREYSKDMAMLNNMFNAGKLSVADYATAQDNLIKSTTQYREAERAAKKATEDRADAQKKLVGVMENYHEVEMAMLPEKKRAIAELQGQYDSYREVVLAAYESEQISIDKLIGDLKKLDSQEGQAIAKAGTSFDQMTQFAEQAANNIQDTFSDFLFDPFQDGVQGMLSDFTDTIRHMASQALSAHLMEKLFGGFGKNGSMDIGGLLGDGLSMLGGLFSSPVAHGGWDVGTSPPATRAVDPMLFAGAHRFHNGLAPDEFPAILQRGERVQSRSEVAKGQPEPQNSGVKIINVIDPKMVGEYMSSSAGERIIMNTIRNNPSVMNSLKG